MIYLSASGAQALECPLIGSRWLEVGDGHSLHLAQYGNPDGVPLLYLHGGPGAGCSLEDARLFDLRHYHILLLDQRGAGRSRPQGALTHNSLSELILDLERVRQALALESWCLAGGSFGATLGLIYSGLYPDRVRAQAYWGLFIPSEAGIAWLYGHQGAARMFPANYQRFSAGIPVTEGLPLLFEYFHRGVFHSNAALAERALRRWLDWEMALAFPGAQLLGSIDSRARGLAHIELHFARCGYFDAEAQLTAVLPAITAPTLILQGERDWVCAASIVNSFSPLQHCMGDSLTLRQVAGGYHSLADVAMHRAVTAAGNWMLDVCHRQ